MSFFTKTVLPFAGLLLFAGLYYWFFIRQVGLMRQHGKYTVGYVTGWTQTLKSGRSIDYRCAINGVTYKGSVHEEPDMNSAIGARYAVEFDSLRPGSNWAYYDMPVPDSVGSPPPGGWSKRTFERRYATWQYADSLRQLGLSAQQDSIQLVRWQQAHRP